MFCAHTGGRSSLTAVHSMKTNQPFYIGAMAVIALAAGACASAPPAPEASLQAARQAITTAEGGDASTNAPGELAEARSKMAEADAAVKAGQMASAEQLALQSRASADLAAAKTASIKALAVNAEMKASNAALAQELNRNTGERK
jgi:hypothetical protein